MLTTETGSIAQRLRRMKGAITAGTLSGLLGLAPVTLYKLGKTGKIPCLRLGGAVRFDPARVADWLDANEVTQ